MGTITLPNGRACSDFTFNIKLKDGGLFIDWADLTDIKAYVFSDAQRALAGKCDVSIDPSDSTVLVCEYAATKPQYPGINSIIVRAKYRGREKTYDKPAVNIVPRTFEASGSVVLQDPVVDIEIVVEDVKSSIMDTIIASCLQAAEDAEHAAHLIPNQVLLDCEQATDEANAAAERANAAGITSAEANIDDNEPGTPSVDVSLLNKVLTLVFHHIKGEKGDTGATPNISIGSVSTGEPGTAVVVTMTGTAENPVLNIVIPQGQKGDQGNTGSSVEFPYELVNNLRTKDATKGLSAEMGAYLGDKSVKMEDTVDESYIAENFTAESVDMTSVTLRNYTITDANKYGTNGDNKHAIIPVAEGDVIDVTANSSNGTKAVFVTNLNLPASGGDIPSVSGSTVVSISAGEYKRFIAPEGAVAFLLLSGSSRADLPSLVTAYRLIEAPQIGNKTIAVVSANDYVNGTNTLTTQSGFYGYACPVKSGHKYIVDISNAGNAAKYYAFLSDIVAKGAPIISKDSVGVENSHFVLTAPSDGYLLVTKNNSSFTVSVVEVGIALEGNDKDVALAMLYDKQELGSYAIRDYQIKDDTGLYATSTTYKHVLVPVSPGQFVKVVAGESNAVQLAFLTSDATPVSGGMPAYAALTGKINVPDSSTQVYKVPAGANYLYVYRGSAEYSYQRDPQYIGISGTGSFITQSDVDGIEQIALDAHRKLGKRIYTEQLNYNLQSNGKFGTSVTYKHAALPVSEGQKYLLRSDVSSTVRVAYATSNEYTSDGDIPFVDGTGIMLMPKMGVYYEFTIPAGCSYLLFNNSDIYGTICYQESGFHPVHGFTQIIEGNEQTFMTGNKGALILKPGVEYRVMIDSNLPSDFNTGTTLAFALYYSRGGVNTRIAGWTSSSGIPSYYDFTAVEADYYYVGGRAPYGTRIVCRFFRIEELYGASGILALNPDSDMMQKFVLARKKTYNSSNITPLVLAHVSDVHGSGAQMERFVEFANHWKANGYVDELIDTGDIVEDNYPQGVAWRNAISGIEKVISVVGNHDTHASTVESESAEFPAGQNEWQYHSNISLDSSKRNDSYNLIMVGPDSEHPYISNWGVTQPTDAATNGYCYYYKDYAAKNLRMIALDVMGYNQTQDEWLQATLADAKTAGYHVIILAHFCGEVMTGLECNYTSLFGPGTSRSGIDGYNEYAYHIPISVDAFQTAGGIFVGYLMGHYHRDMVNILTDYPKQLAFAVSSGGRPVIRDTSKVLGSKSYDDFQVVSINTYDKTVRLFKVGADIDYYSRKKGTICVSYEIETDAVKGILGEGL